MTDHRLEEEITRALAANPRVHSGEIAVEARDGNVILRGTVGNLLERTRALRTTRAVPGVRTVDDQIRVRLIGLGRADAETTAAVLEALIGEDALHADDVDVTSRDGVVTLRGPVELPFQRAEAERVAMSVPGVSHVRNELDVWPRASADDVAGELT